MSDPDAIQGFRNDFGFGPSDRPEQKPLPFRIVCVANFRGAAHEPAEGLVRIDAPDFDATLSAMGPRVFFDLPGTPAAEVDLTLRGLRDFEPARFIKGVPALAAIQSFIDKLEDTQEGRITTHALLEFADSLRGQGALAPLIDATRAQLAARAPATPEAPPAATMDATSSAIESIFSMVDAAPGARSNEGGVEAAARAVSGGPGGPDLSALIQRAQALLDEKAVAVIRNPQFRRLEATWRGLRYLCRAARGTRIELLNAADGQAAERIEAMLARPDRDGEVADPVSLIVCDIPLRNTSEGVSLIQALGELGEGLRAPVVFGLDATFFGKDSMPEIAALDAPGNLINGEGFDQFRALRDKTAARWLVPCLNGFAARQPYNRTTHGLAETIAGDGDVLWASPAWLVAAAVARAMETTGWPAAHTGIVDGELPGLPVFEMPGRDSQYPLQALLPDRHLKDFTRAGLTPLMCQANNDAAWLLLAPVLHGAGGRTERENSLAYALTAARLAVLVENAGAALVVPGDADRTQVNLERFLDGLLSDTGPQAGATVQIRSDRIELSVRTGRAVMNGLELALSLPWVAHP